MDAAVKLVREGKVSSFAEAARRAGCPPSGVSARWNSTEKGKPPFKKEAVKVKPAEKAADEESPKEKELARRLRETQKGRDAARAESRSATLENKRLEEDLSKLEATLGIIKAVENAPRPDWTVTPEPSGKHRAILMAAFSDFHIGEVVEPGEMAFYNAYNPTIAEQRVRRFFERTILMSRRFLTGVKYDGIVMPNLGDTISGDIHEEFCETNGLTNYEAVTVAVPLLVEGIGLFADEFGKVHVPCVPGNHPRDSRKPRYKKRSAHNADTLISQLVASHFKNDDRVTFDIPDGISADFEVYDTKFRIEHGDEAKGGGGIQGAMLPIALRTHRVRKQSQAEGKPFDVLMIGHWHQLMSMPAQGFICNGAGKGYDEYARGKGFAPEPPQQALIVVTPEHGIGVQAPLFVQHRKKEGW